MGILNRLQHAWNAFISNDESNDGAFRPPRSNYIYGSMSSHNPSRPIISAKTERSIVNAVYNRIALDCASMRICHAKIDEDGRYLEEVNSELNDRLTISANKDQTGRQFMIDVVESMFDEGYVAIVPIDTNESIKDNNTFEILSWRTGKIIQWYPDYVQVRVYNDRTGQREDITFPKKKVAIIENPLYAIMNEPNSTLQRLIHKLNLLDLVDEQSSSTKLNLIVQLPYIIKTDARREQAENRRKDIEDQLANSKYGIAYTDGTEHITQLNRPLDNNLVTEVENLTKMLYSQLGMTDAILNGTADERTMINYTNRTIEPILNAIIDELKRKFLTKTARTQGQTIMVFSDPFKLVPMSQIAEIADKFTRNAILSSNEMRQIIGYKPVDDADAYALRNKNLNMDDNTAPAEQVDEQPTSILDVPVSDLSSE